MSERAAKTAQAQDAAMRSYIQQTAGSGVSPAEQVAKLSELHDQGKLSDEEFAAAKVRGAMPVSGRIVYLDSLE